MVVLTKKFGIRPIGKAGETMNEKDPRFKTAIREAMIGLILVFVNFLWWFAFAYGMGSRAVANYTYVFGFPAWFFYSCIVGFLLMVLLVIFAVNRFFKEVPFEEEEKRGDGQ